MSGIRLSKQFGVNPSLLICFVCEESYGVALVGKLPQDAEAPRRMRGPDLCDKCQALIKAGGIFCVEADDRNQRTGRLVGIKGEAWDRIFTVPRPAKGVAYIAVDAFEKLFGEVK